jgi:hypothetical protein
VRPARFRKLEPERPQEPGRLVSEPELGEIMAGGMIIDGLPVPCLGPRKISLRGHEGGEILHPGGIARGTRVEAGIKALQEGMPGRADRDDDIGVLPGKRFQVSLGQGGDRLAVAEMPAGSAAANLIRRNDNTVAETGKRFDDTLPDLGKEIFD